jgi:hypothetical protein
MTTKKELQSRIQQLEMLVSAETDNTFYPGQSMTDLYRSRYDYDRDTILSECLRAWRVNPLARRIVQLYTDFIIGEGLGIRSNHKATHKYLTDWWNHPLNNFNEQIPAWCDELTRAGNLFFVISVNPMDGMIYVRPLPSEQVKDIVSADNDIRQEVFYLPKDITADKWQAYDRTNQQQTFVLHYAVNRPIGSAWGEPLLAPLLPQLGRYMTWLEDRARINHFRTAYMYVLQGKFNSEKERREREDFINSHKPTPGSVLVHNESEKWSILAAQLDSFDASQDGLNIKKAIAAGAGLPLHYLAEPESSTRTTADAAGTPTFRSLERIQKTFLGMLDDMADIALAYRKQYDRRVNLNSVVQIINPDITERDNSLLALSVSRAYPPLIDLFDRKLIESPELMRMVYRMAGETFDEEKPVPPGIRKPLVTQPELPMPTGSIPSEDDEPKEGEK